MGNSANTLLSRLASGCLIVGAVLGLAGTFVSSAPSQARLWALDSVALVAGTTLLALKYFRAGVDLVAAGFLVFAIGEGVLLAGTAAGPVGSVPAFAAGTALWATALLMVSVTPVFAVWIRVVGVIAACLFAVTASRLFAGESLLPTSSPLPFFAYPFLVFTLLGWAWSQLRPETDSAVT
jgi:hypothetical protein